MKKLNGRKIRWIVREIEKSELSICRIARIQQLMTNHSVQFTSMPRETCAEPEPNEFQKFLGEEGIQHIKARVKHPQSNGKVERVFRTLEGLKGHFR